MPVIDVVIPTIAGREDCLARAVDAYESRSEHRVRIHVTHDHATCGLAWNAGVRAIDRRGDYLHLTADDIEPLPGWDMAAIAACRRGIYPAPRVDLPGSVTELWGSSRKPLRDGEPTRASYVPFMPWATWDAIGPVLCTHYGSDDWLSWRANREGHPIQFVYDYALVHDKASVGRGAGMPEPQRRRHDAAVLKQAMRQFDGGDTDAWRLS